MLEKPANTPLGLPRDDNKFVTNDSQVVHTSTRQNLEEELPPQPNQQQQQNNQQHSLVNDQNQNNSRNSSTTLFPLILSWVLLSGSGAGNLYLFWSYLDIRGKYRGMLHGDRHHHDDRYRDEDRYRD